MKQDDDELDEVWVHIPRRGISELNYLVENIKEARKEKPNLSFHLYSDVYADSSHVHCEVCWQCIANGNPEEVETAGFYSNETWVCQQSFSMFIEPEDYTRVVNTLDKAPKP